MVSNIIGQRCWCQKSSGKRSWGHRSELGNKRPGIPGEILVMKIRGSVQNNKHGSKLTGQKWKVEGRRSFRSKIMVSKIVVSKVKGRRSVGWKVSGVRGWSGERSWCHRSWCPTSSVKDAGAKGHQAKGHRVTGQNLEIKGQEFQVKY